MQTENSATEKTDNCTAGNPAGDVRGIRTAQTDKLGFTM